MRSGKSNLPLVGRLTLLSHSPDSGVPQLRSFIHCFMDNCLNIGYNLMYKPDLTLDI